MNGTRGNTTTFHYGTLLQQSWRLLTSRLALFGLLGIAVLGVQDALTDLLLPRIGSSGPGLWIALAAVMLYGITAEIWIMIATRDAAQGERRSAALLASETASRMGWVVMTGVLLLIVLAAWTMLLIVPGIAFGVFYLFTFNAVVLRGETGWSAMKYSMRLVRGRWWSMFGYALGIIVFSVPVELLRSALDGSSAKVGLMIVIAGCAGVFQSIALTLLFLRCDTEVGTEQ